MTIRLQPLPPKEAVDYLAAKGLQVSFAWEDVYAEEHAAAFTVAKMGRLDLLATVKEHVTRAIQDGRTLQQFAADLRPILEREGWWGKQEMTDPLTGETKMVQLGSPRRLQIIYDTNLRTAYSAGRWERFARSAGVLPLLTYRTMRDGRVRPMHRSWDGVTLPQGHQWWDTHYPPNGYRCRCIAYAISAADAQKLADAGRPIQYEAPPTVYKEWVNPRTGEVRQVPAGIDPGFDYNPGKGRMAQLEKLLREKEAAFDRPAFIKASRTVQEAEQVAVSLGVKSADFKNLDIANAVNASLVPLKDRGLPVPDHVMVQAEPFVRWARENGADPADLTAAFAPHKVTGETYLVLNPAYLFWGNLAQDAAVQFGKGEWSSDDPAHILWHEMGHLVQYKSAPDAYKSLAAQGFDAGDAAIAAGVSRYAAESPREFVAEVFAALLAGRSFDDGVMTLYRQLKGPML